MNSGWKNDFFCVWNGKNEEHLFLDDQNLKFRQFEFMCALVFVYVEIDGN